MVFPDLGLHVKIMCLRLLFCIIIINLHLHMNPFSRLWCGSTIWLFAVENLHHKLVLFSEIWVPTLKISPLKNLKTFLKPKKEILKKPLSHRQWPQESKPSTAQRPEAKPSAPLGARSLHQPMIGRIPLRTLGPPHLRGQSPVSNQTPAPSYAR